jgi:hypothetical protein
MIQALNAVIDSANGSAIEKKEGPRAPNSINLNNLIFQFVILPIHQ